MDSMASLKVNCEARGVRHDGAPACRRTGAQERNGKLAVHCMPKPYQCGVRIECELGVKLT